MTEPVRLAKRLAEILSCSRSEAELYIESGRVTVDGQMVDMPHFRVSDQKVELLAATSVLEPVQDVTFLLHKPAGIDAESTPAAQLLPTAMRAADDRSGISPLRRHLNKLKIAGPLPVTASGLVVLSQDWRISKKQLGDAASIEQEWIVDVSGELASNGLKLLNQPLFLDGKPLPAAKVSWQNETRLRFAVKDLRPGQIEYLCESVGLEISAMKRLRLGRLSMAGLKPGQWRYLGPHERF